MVGCRWTLAILYCAQLQWRGLDWIPLNKRCGSKVFITVDHRLTLLSSWLIFCLWLITSKLRLFVSMVMLWTEFWRTVKAVLTKPSLALALSSSWYILSVFPGLVLTVMYAVGLFVVSSAVVRKKIGCTMEYVWQNNDTEINHRIRVIIIIVVVAKTNRTFEP